MTTKTIKMATKLPSKMMMKYSICFKQIRIANCWKSLKRRIKMDSIHHRITKMASLMKAKKSSKHLNPILEVRVKLSRRWTHRWHRTSPWRVSNQKTRRKRRRKSRTRIKRSWRRKYLSEMSVRSSVHEILSKWESSLNLMTSDWETKMKMANGITRDGKSRTARVYPVPVVTMMIMMLRIWTITQ